MINHTPYFVSKSSRFHHGSSSSPVQPCHATWPGVSRLPQDFSLHEWLTALYRFNSYTQQICVDDAVVIDDQRPENIVTNDGTTMRIMAQKSATPSAWTRQKEVITSNPATIVLEENAKKAKADVALIADALADDSAKGTVS